MSNFDMRVPLDPPGDRPDVVIDLSNVCRDGRFSSDVVPWDRYLRVLRALQLRYGRKPHGVAFADANLRSFLSNVEAQAFDREEARGCLRIVQGDADVEILAFARDTGASVVSRDGYTGHRQIHPWIQGDTTRFIGWRPAGGKVALYARKMGVRSPFSQSEGRESDTMKGARLTPEIKQHRDVLMHRFRCENKSCSLARRYPNHLEVPPRMREGSPVCPTCGHELVDLGPRDQSLEFVLEVGEVELRRLSLKPGEELVVGRREVEGPVRRHGVDAPIGRVSREHVRLRVTPEGEAEIIDLGSRNGSSIVSWRRGEDAWSDPKPIEADHVIGLSRRDAVLLAGIVRLRPSGRRYDFAERGKPVVLGAADQAMTRLVEEEDQ